MNFKRSFWQSAAAGTAVFLIMAGAGVALAGTWAAPTSAPPAGNADAPITLSSAGQIKAGGLTLNTSGAQNGLLVQTGNVGIGTLSPNDKLEVNGNLRVDGVLTCLQGTCPPNSAMRMTPNFHLNSGAGYAVIANWDNGTTGAAQTFRVGNGAGSGDVFYVLANGGVYAGGNVGIGTQSPSRPLEVNNALKFTNASGDPNDGVMGTALFGAPGLNIVGINTDNAGRKISEWGSITQYQNDAGNYFAGRTYFPQIIGAVTIGSSPSSGTNVLEVDGSMLAGHYNTISDERLKKYIRTLPDALDKVAQLRGVSFLWKDSSQAEANTGEQIGVIAQEVEKVYPELVHTDPDTGMKSVQYSQLVGPLIEAVKELKAENDHLKIKQTEIEARISILEQKR